ncbi:RHS repeat-associated core domain-containing protein [Couchioplanes caeruleus]
MVSDHHGTGQLAIDAGTLTSTRRRTTPFGESRGPAPIWPDRKAFVGGTADPTGLTHLGAREYDPSTGRFISVDPLADFGDPQTLHGYAYANNNPITFTDPDGLAVYPWAGGGGGGMGSVPRISMPWNPFKGSGRGSGAKGHGSTVKKKPGKTVTPRFSRTESRDAHNEKVFGRARASSRSTPKPPRVVVRGPKSGGGKAKPKSRPKSSTKATGGKKSGGKKPPKMRPSNPPVKPKIKPKSPKGKSKPANPKAEAERARDEAGRKPNGKPNRDSPVYVGGYDKNGNVMGAGNGPRGHRNHAEDIIQDRMPGAKMTQPYAWRRNKDTGQLEWRPHTVCPRCQGRYPRELFDPRTRGESGGSWVD